MTGTAEKADRRAKSYRRAIGQFQAADQGRAALAEALRWLRGEAAHAGKLRPRDAAALHDQLTSQLVTLAGAVAGEGFRTDRHRRDLARMRAAGQHAEAFTHAAGWLSSSATSAARADPSAAPVLYRDLTDRIAGLAAEVPGYRPDRRHH